MLVVPVSVAFNALCTALIACEIGQRLNSAFERINIAIDQLDWYLLPIELKRIFPMIVGITQQPIELDCFGSITCTRSVFKEVSHNSEPNQSEQL